MVDTFVLEPRRIRVEEVTVPIKGLGADLDGFTMCQITDVHHSPIIGLGYVDEVVELANSLKPDLMVLTGDYIDESKSYMEPVIKSLSRLRAPYGTIAVLGNHDYFIGAEYSADVVRSAGIPLLQNSHTIIERGRAPLCIAGTRDYFEDSPDVGAALKGVAPDVPRILLNHHPDYCEYLPGGYRIDLILSGHTHGGQVRVPISRFAPIVPSNFGQKYSGGLVTLDRTGGTQVYVSRGIGVVLIPVRFNCPPELTRITLVSA